MTCTICFRQYDFFCHNWKCLRPDTIIILHRCFQFSCPLLRRSVNNGSLRLRLFRPFSIYSRYFDLVNTPEVWILLFSIENLLRVKCFIRSRVGWLVLWVRSVVAIYYFKWKIHRWRDKRLLEALKFDSIVTLKAHSFGTRNLNDFGI